MPCCSPKQERSSACHSLPCTSTLQPWLQVGKDKYFHILQSSEYPTDYSAKRIRDRKAGSCLHSRFLTNLCLGHMWDTRKTAEQVTILQLNLLTAAARNGSCGPAQVLDHCWGPLGGPCPRILPYLACLESELPCKLALCMQTRPAYSGVLHFLSTYHKTVPSPNTKKSAGSQECNLWVVCT